MLRMMIRQGGERTEEAEREGEGNPGFVNILKVMQRERKWI